jgi:hypothetical protein
MKYKDLKDTVDLMGSSDYKDRFRAEYYQTETRCEKLKAMLEKYLIGKLTFQPACSYDLLHEQYVCMKGYIECLKKRAKVEGISL